MIFALTSFMTFVIFFIFILFIIAKKCFNLYLKFKKTDEAILSIQLKPV